MNHTNHICLFSLATACILKEHSFSFSFQGQTMPAAAESPSPVKPRPPGRKGRQSPAITLRPGPPLSPGRQRLAPRDNLRASQRPRTPPRLRALLRSALWPRGNGSNMPKARNREASLIADLQEHFSA